MQPAPRAPLDPAPHPRIAVATPLHADAGDELLRVSWLRTVARLALQPSQHPWRRGWKLQQKSPLVALIIALGLLLLFAASGCASTPRISLSQQTQAPEIAAGPRCESVLVSQELQIPPEGPPEIGELRVTLRDLPEVTGRLRVLVRKPRFPATLDLDADGPVGFDKVMDVSGGRELTLVLSRPDDARDGWPRNHCKACRLDVEVSGLFGAREGFGEFFNRAMLEAAAIERGFAQQTADGGEHPSPALRESGARLLSEAKRCGVQIEPVVDGVIAALVQLENARAAFYASPDPHLPDAAAVGKAFRDAGAAIDALPAAAAAARMSRWSSALNMDGPLRTAMLHLHLALQASAVPAESRDAAARWIALATAPDADAVERRSAALPRIRDLKDAEDRLAWVDPQAGAQLPLPGLAPAVLKVPWYRAWPKGRKCIGTVGAAPVSDKSAEAASVAAMLGAGKSQLELARLGDLPRVREVLGKARALLCEPLAVDVEPLFSGLEERELGSAAERLEAIYAEADPRRENDEIARAVSARTSRLLCSLLSPETIERRVSSVVAYKIFVEGGTQVLDYLPGPLICDRKGVTPREIRRRLREAYRAALDKHAVADRLCPMRGGKCPEEVAASVRRLFGLPASDIAAPAAPEKRALDFPPPFGFSDAWVDKLDRCGREACDALARLKADAPPGQFEGAICAPPAPGAEHPQDVTLDKPESPTSVTLSSCDPHAGVRLTLRRRPEAGMLVSIASNHPFRYGSENVTRQGRNPQLGRIYERVADLGDRADVTALPSGAFEVALTPTVENQVFWFFTLRRRDY